MVMTLQDRGYIEQGESDGRYTLTLKMFRLAHQQQPIKSLVQTALPLLRELAERARQSCHLSLFRSGRVIIAAQVDSPERWSFGLKVGEAMELDRHLVGPCPARLPGRGRAHPYAKQPYQCGRRIAHGPRPALFDIGDCAVAGLRHDGEHPDRRGDEYRLSHLRQ